MINMISGIKMALCCYEEIKIQLIIKLGVHVAII